MSKSIFNVGGVCLNDSFLGRKNDVQRLRKDFLEGSDGIGQSLVGLPRIGKTSLVYNAFSEEELSRYPETFYFYTSLKKYENVYRFWSDILKKLAKKAKEEELREELQEYIDEAKEAEADYLAQKGTPWGDLTDAVTEFFKALKENGIRVLLALDEFDYSATLFEQNGTRFELIRCLRTEPETRVSFLLICRRNPEKFETNIAGSSFHAAFPSHYLCQFDESEMEEYWGVLRDFYQIDLGEGDRDLMISRLGTLPLLLSLVGDLLAKEREEKEGPEIDIPAILRKNVSLINNAYRDIIKILRDDKELERIVPFVIGPRCGVSSTDLQELQERRFVEESDDASGLRSISDSFRTFLAEEIIDAPLFQQLSGFTKLIRKLIQKEAIGVVRTLHPIGNTINELQLHCLILTGNNYKTVCNWDHFKRDEENRGNKAQYLQVQNFESTWNLMKRCWPIFSKYFNNQSCKDFEEAFALIIRVRNPFAHFNDEFISEADQEAAGIQCQTIQQLIERNWSKGAEEPNDDEVLLEAKKNMPPDLQREPESVKNCVAFEGDSVLFIPRTIFNLWAECKKKEWTKVLGVAKDREGRVFPACIGVWPADFAKYSNRSFYCIGKPQKATIDMVSVEDNLIYLSNPWEEKSF